MIERSKSAADVVIKLLQAGHDNPVAAHAGYNFRHRVGVVGEGLLPVAFLRDIVHAPVPDPLMLKV